MKILSKSIYLFLFMSLASGLQAYNPPGNRLVENDFLVVSIPKSGTHLLTKLLIMLTGKQSFAMNRLDPLLDTLTEDGFTREVLKCKIQNNFIYGHTTNTNYGPFFQQFIITHPNYVAFLQIRDLRDLIVSYVNFFDEKIKKEFVGQTPRFSDMLTHILNRDNSIEAKKLEQNILACLELMSLPNVVVLRFEDMIGPKGGGSKAAQDNTIASIASHLQIPLSGRHLDKITAQLFGNNAGPHSGTFRKGKIGAWRECFTPQQYQLFLDKWAPYHVALGYPLN